MRYLFYVLLCSYVLFSCDSFLARNDSDSSFHRLEKGGHLMKIDTVCFSDLKLDFKNEPLQEIISRVKCFSNFRISKYSQYSRVLPIIYHNRLFLAKKVSDKEVVEDIQRFYGDLVIFRSKTGGTVNYKYFQKKIQPLIPNYLTYIFEYYALRSKGLRKKKINTSLWSFDKHLTHNLSFEVHRIEDIGFSFFYAKQAIRHLSKNIPVEKLKLADFLGFIYYY